MPTVSIMISMNIILKTWVSRKGCCCCKLLQSCLTLCNPMDCSPPGSSVHGILQARMLEWVAISSSRWHRWAPVNLCGMSEGSVRGSEQGTSLCPQEADICNRSRACSVTTSGLCLVGPREETASRETRHLGWAWKGRNHVDFWRR